MVDVALRAAGELTSTPTSRCSTCAPCGRSTARRSSLRWPGPRAPACCRRRARSTRCRGRGALAGRARGLRAARRAARAASPPPDTPVPFAPELEDAYIPSTERVAAARGGSVPTDGDEPCPARPSTSTRDDRVALFRLDAAAAPDRGARLAALPPGTRLRLGLHRPRPGGRGGGGRATRSGPTTSCAPLNRELACHLARGVTPAQTSSATSSARATAPPADATATCTSACPSAGSSRSSRCSATSARVTGAALAFKRRREPRVALTFCGDGAIRVGDVHEGLNLAAVLAGAGRVRAAVQRLRVLDAVERQMVNTYIAAPDRGRLAHPRLARRRHATRSPSLDTVRAAVERARERRRPAAVEAVSLRLRRARRARRRAATWTRHS